MDCSPDGRVTDLTANKPLGLIEVKCPLHEKRNDTHGSMQRSKFLLSMTEIFVLNKTILITKFSCNSMLDRVLIIGVIFVFIQKRVYPFSAYFLTLMAACLYS